MWSTITFAASMVTFAWMAVDPVSQEVTAQQGGESGATIAEITSTTRFGMPTAWTITGLAAALTCIALGSLVFFWRVCVSGFPALISVWNSILSLGVEANQKASQT